MTTTFFLVLMLLFLAVSICYFGIKATLEIVDKNNKDYLNTINKIKPKVKK
mgnify:FL=1|tara:strand:- start:711 stop:863 length:153 start_codon:yes stop_codon:yes gene_type:complete